MTVYVVQEPKGINIISATKYGDIEIVLPATEHMLFDTENIVEKIREKLKNFTEEDYLLLIGDPAAIGVATYFALKTNKRCQFLKWDRQEKMYYVVEVTV
tara:strand:- start:349 stop:648 length:300 start_codon:yes stop_codon:yes gene_type:complete